MYIEGGVQKGGGMQCILFWALMGCDGTDVPVRAARKYRLLLYR
jgi:hypothetical protein